MTVAPSTRLEGKLDDIIDRLTRLEERTNSRDREAATTMEFMRSGLERLEKRLDAQDLVRGAEYLADKRTAIAERDSLTERVVHLEEADDQRAKDARTTRNLVIASFVAPILVGIVVALIVASIIGTPPR